MSAFATLPSLTIQCSRVTLSFPQPGSTRTEHAESQGHGPFNVTVPAMVAPSSCLEHPPKTATQTAASIVTRYFDIEKAAKIIRRQNPERKTVAFWFVKTSDFS